MSEYKLLIDGKLVDGARTGDVFNPATGQVVAHYPLADESLLNQAVAAAKAALPSWASTSPEERGAMLESLATALEERSQDIARVLTCEHGKPLAQASIEIMATVYALRSFAEMRISSRTLQDDDQGKVIEIFRPIGVVAAIMPWNFPLMMVATKIAPALIAGNTVVAKPAPTTPLATLLLAELCVTIFPPGVVNMICDENDLGPSLTRHPDIAKIAFTGSTATGKKVMEAAAGTIKRVTLELGGNDAAIVLDDADPIATAGKIFGAFTMNAGQICTAVKRAYVPDAIYDMFCDEMARLASEIVVDDGTRQGAEMGPIQNRKQYERLKDLLASARIEGKIIAGGQALDRPGYFIAPTVIRDVSDDARIVREEQFGPILPVMRYSNIDDVIARANDSEYGLGGSVWGADVARATQVAMRLQSGTVWVNQHMALSPHIPFRGAKQSGLGTELGEEGVLEYMQATIVNVAA